MTELVLGVDGGGTKTKIVAVDLNGNEIASGFGKSINSYFIKLEQAVENFKNIVYSLELPNNSHICAISIGDPAMDDSGSDALAELFRERIKNCGIFDGDVKVFSRSDAFMALYGFCGENSGILLISGTGSMGIAKNKDGEIFTVGGWGVPTTDYGSGYYIAVAAINAVFDAFDGISESTLLTEFALRFFGVENVRGLIAVFNGQNLNKSEIAAFAPCVYECALKRDEIANIILSNAGTLLGSYAISLIKRLNEEKCLIGMYGSVFLKNNIVQKKFIETIHNKFKNTIIKFPEISPEYAAAKYAISKLNNKKAIK